MHELQQRALDAVTHWLTVADARLPAGDGRATPRPRVRFDLRGLAAGRAELDPRNRGHPGLIRLNDELLRRHPEDMIGETVPHEVAHLVAVHRFGPRGHGHGEPWRRVMQAFGKAPIRCHRLDARPARRVRYYPYACACQAPVHLSSIRHRRRRRGVEYRCTRCGHTLVYTGEPPRRGRPESA